MTLGLTLIARRCRWRLARWRRRRTRCRFARRFTRCSHTRLARRARRLRRLDFLAFLPFGIHRLLSLVSTSLHFTDRCVTTPPRHETGTPGCSPIASPAPDRFGDSECHDHRSAVRKGWASSACPLPQRGSNSASDGLFRPTPDLVETYFVGWVIRTRCAWHGRLWSSVTISA
jgi:hypothetical protein